MAQTNKLIYSHKEAAKLLGLTQAKALALCKTLPGPSPDTVSAVALTLYTQGMSPGDIRVSIARKNAQMVTVANAAPETAKPETIAKPKEYAINKSELAFLLGTTRSTVSRWNVYYKDFPQPTKDGYDVKECRLWLNRHKVEISLNQKRENNAKRVVASNGDYRSDGGLTIHVTADAIPELMLELRRFFSKKDER